jgi:hypothetical protein
MRSALSVGPSSRCRWRMSWGEHEVGIPVAAALGFGTASREVPSRPFGALPHGCGSAPEALRNCRHPEVACGQVRPLRDVSNIGSLGRYCPRSMSLARFQRHCAT